MTRHFALLLALAATVSVPAAAVRPNEDPEQELQRILAGRVPGPPVDCINLGLAGSSHIVKRTAIVYRIGSRLYVNRPRSGGSALDDDDILVTRTVGTRLCSIDTVNLVDRTSRIPRGFILLGKFVPYSKPRQVAPPRRG